MANSDKQTTTVAALLFSPLTPEKTNHIADNNNYSLMSMPMPTLQDDKKQEQQVQETQDVFVVVPGDNDHDHHDMSTLTRNLKAIKVKIESLSSNDHHNDDQTMGIEDDEDGYKTPTGEEHRIPIDLPCPGAPRKKMSPQKPAKRRRLTYDDDEKPTRTCIEVSEEELASLFPLHSSSNLARNINEFNHHIFGGAGNIKKVNKAKITTLMSFR